MLMQRRFASRSDFKTKIKSVDYILVMIVLLIGIISCFAMYSTDGGQLGYYTINHIIRFSLFASLGFIDIAQK